MICALKEWDTAKYYNQENNPTEEQKRKTINDVKKQLAGTGINITISHLESCSVEDIVNVLACIGYDFSDFKCPGGYEQQPGQVLFNFLHDPVNYPKFAGLFFDKKLDPFNCWNNRHPELYPYAIKKVFGINARYEAKSLQQLDFYLSRNIGILLLLKKPSHWIGIVKYDTVKKIVTYRDAWPGNYWPEELRGTSGKNREIKFDRLLKNSQESRVLIGV